MSADAAPRTGPGPQGAPPRRGWLPATQDAGGGGRLGLTGVLTVVRGTVRGMSEPTPKPAAEPETAPVPPYARQPAPRWPEPRAAGAAEPVGGGEAERGHEAVAQPGFGDVAEAAGGAVTRARTGPEAAHEGRPEPVTEPVEPEPVEAGPVPLGVARTPTGNADVDAVLDRLADADELPTGSHLEVYEDAHRRMRETLEELDRTQGPPPPGPAQPHGNPRPANPAPAPYGQGRARPGPPAPSPSPAPYGHTPNRPGAHPSPYRPGNP